MRLSDFQREAILESVAEVMGEETRVLLFGSRVDDSKRGGDIDLLVEAVAPVEDRVEKKLRIQSRIQRKIGEQKIDLIITHVGEFSEKEAPLVVRNAYREGTLL